MQKSQPPGPVAQRVARHVARVRDEQRLTRAELVERLDAAGRRLSTDVILKIETGRRPADVDDVMSLALALHVSPLWLMFGDGPDSIDVTPTWRTDPTTARIWAQGADLGADTDRARRVRDLISQLHSEITGKSQDGEH